MQSIELSVRYGREIADPGVESHEVNLRRGKLRWKLPVDEIALVLVDCWEYFPLESFVGRAEAICRTKIQPVIAACRELGLAVVHAPSPNWAANYPEFHYGLEAPEKDLPRPSVKGWPPELDEAFAVPRTSEEPVYKAWHEKAFPDHLKISPHVAPAGDDIVVSTGDDLHALCRERRIKHLVYAGFATNICVLFRDYGVRAMKERGYNIVFIRDSTTAVESGETVGDLGATKAAVFFIETKVGVSVTATAFVEACQS